MADTSFDHKEAQTLVRQFRRWSVGGDVSSIQPDSVPWCEYWGRLMPTVVVHSILILHLCKHHLCFLNSQCHVFCKFIGRLQGRAWLLGFKAHARVVSSVDHEGGLLSRQVYTVVIVELALGQEAIPVILSSTCECVQIAL
jgi:hypothetical protein